MPWADQTPEKQLWCRFVNKEIASLLRSAKVYVEAVTHVTYQY